VGVPIGGVSVRGQASGSRWYFLPFLYEAPDAAFKDSDIGQQQLVDDPALNPPPVLRGAARSPSAQPGVRP
jgi:hypothetical protein